MSEGVCYGQTDLSLQTPLSQQGTAVAVLRQQLPLSAPVFTSPLRRCAELAEALSSRPLQDPRLQELHFGDWEMQAWDTIGAHALDAWAKDLAGFRPPGGETGYELQQRALHWLKQTSALHEEVIVITHAGVMRALQAHHQSLPGEQWLTLRYAYGQLVCLDFPYHLIHAAPVQ